MEEIIDPVFLLTIDVQKNTNKTTGPYERNGLVVWRDRAEKENSELILAWEIVEIGEGSYVKV